MSLALAELEQKLRRFTDDVAHSLAYATAIALLDDHSRTGQVSYEIVGPGHIELTFMWDVLSHEEYDGKLAARLYTHVCDDRPRAQLGSAWAPLCGGGWLFPDGTFEQHPVGKVAPDGEVDQA